MVRRWQLGSYILKVWSTIKTFNVFWFRFSNLTNKCFSIGENTEGCASEEQIPEANPEDTGISVESEKLDVENKHYRNVVFQDCEKDQDNTTKDPSNDVKTPNTETRTGCLIKYNVSTTPCLQRVRVSPYNVEGLCRHQDRLACTPSPWSPGCCGPSCPLDCGCLRSVTCRPGFVKQHLQGCASSMVHELCSPIDLHSKSQLLPSLKSYVTLEKLQGEPHLSEE